MTHRRFALTSSIAFFAALVAACDGDSPGDRCTSSDDCAAGRICIDERCVARPDGSTFDGSIGDAGARDGAIDAPSGPACFSSDQCDGGVCIGNTCCGRASVCGESCCGAGTVCFANACVTPGAACFNDDGCAENEYCEPALSDRPGDVEYDAGLPDAGRVCAPTLERPGRCLALPARCADGQDGGCLPSCEFRPEVGQLDAVEEWSWGQPTPPEEFPQHIDVWSTPVVGRVYDANCDGNVDDRDPPNVVFVSGRAIDDTTGLGTCCQCIHPNSGGGYRAPTACQEGVLRVIDGRNGTTLWSLPRPFEGSVGFSGASMALGDLDDDGVMEIVALSGEGYIVVLDGQGRLLRRSTEAVMVNGARPVITGNADSFGWGGGIALADIDGQDIDGRRQIEIIYGASVYRDNGTDIELVFRGTQGEGGALNTTTSTLADLDEDGTLELVAGNTAYRADGAILWNTQALSSTVTLRDGFPGVGDFDGDGRAEVVIIGTTRTTHGADPATVERTITVLDGATGAVVAGPLDPQPLVTLPEGQSLGSGGPPTIADFDGDGHPEVGVAYAYFYIVFEVDVATHAITLRWHQQNHDLSSSVTGSTVFDFEGDGRAEVLYADECYVWVYDGPTGNIRYAGLTTSFTGTEATVVADVDSDGHADMLVVSNGAHPGDATNVGWRCNIAPWNMPDTALGRPAWTPPTGFVSYRGVRLYRDSARSWVGTRGVWNQHTYHVTNVCVPGDDACEGTPRYGAIPRRERRNWDLPWLNNFRQNIGQEGIFRAPDATVALSAICSAPIELVATVRNLGEALLPAGVVVAFYTVDGSTRTEIGRGTTTRAIFPNQAELVHLDAPATANADTRFVASIVIDPAMPTFRQCRDDNDDSNEAMAACVE